MTKLAIISDIHANLLAFEAVLAKIDELAADMIVCTGDIVGYGPRPAECVGLIREREIACLLGNHDQYVTLIMDPRIERLRDDIRQSIEWTQGKLPMNDLRWLADLPMRFDVEDFFYDFSFVHGAFGSSPWRYCNRSKHFLKNFEAQDVPVAFCGHSHVPAMGIFSGFPDYGDEELEEDDKLDAVKVVRYRRNKLPDAEKIMINVGSVGQPRDKDPRACFVTFDIEERIIEQHRVEYDIEAVQAEILAAGLAEKSANRLAEGR